MEFPLPASIAELLPHKPPMVLIDNVHSCNLEHIQCSSQSHLDQFNPLRQNSRLSVFAGVEYAAQAMALHARLTVEGEKAFARPRKGFLAVANKLQAHALDLDEDKMPLWIEVTKLNGDMNNSLYSFAIRVESRMLLEGQLIAVMAEPEMDSAELRPD